MENGKLKIENVGGMFIFNCQFSTFNLKKYENDRRD